MYVLTLMSVSPRSGNVLFKANESGWKELSCLCIHPLCMLSQCVIDMSFDLDSLCEGSHLCGVI